MAEHALRESFYLGPGFPKPQRPPFNRRYSARFICR